MARTQAADYGRRREAILDAAAALFARRRFHGTSMADIAGACGMSKSLLYHYYGSKEALLSGIMLSHVGQLGDDVRAVTARDLPPGEALAALIHAFMGHYAGAADRQKVLLNELDTLPAGERAAVVERQRALIDAVQSLLAALLPGDSDPARQRARTMLVFGMINWTHIWFDPAGRISADALADMVVEMASGDAGRTAPA